MNRVFLSFSKTTSRSSPKEDWWYYSVFFCFFLRLPSSRAVFRSSVPIARPLKAKVPAPKKRSKTDCRPCKWTFFEVYIIIAAPSRSLRTSSSSQPSSSDRSANLAASRLRGSRGSRRLSPWIDEVTRSAFLSLSIS